MAIEPHTHEYALGLKKWTDGTEVRAFCKHPECDHELSSNEIMDRIDAYERATTLPLLAEF